MHAALETGLDALGISDHDTFSGYDQARTLAFAHGLDLVCGIELGTKMATRNATKTVHLLGYFFDPTHAALRALRAWRARLVEPDSRFQVRPDA